MAEKSMQAYFHSAAEAQSIITKLKALRVKDIQINQVGSNPLSNQGTGWDMLQEENADTAMMSAVGFEGEDTASEGGRLDTLLTALIDEVSYEQAVRVVRDGGGVI
ncbi:hypothetical protein [Paenibacillus sp. FSL H7-0331]|uniref:hypothetical protein n=1 Tax=Paenibacillus sp. FSL H7-0331 TaxID=1920421 RepID=UPI00096BFFB9|nr:hypothetical protein [Paenibacillus sp. FSL H7-0331]OMF18305.1 hypothetical protein BK127_11035 [Paenibacillus sp. FSL H7-0331]